jgi:hypothetical protein
MFESGPYSTGVVDKNTSDSAAAATVHYLSAHGQIKHIEGSKI